MDLYSSLIHRKTFSDLTLVDEVGEGSRGFVKDHGCKGEMESETGAVACERDNFLFTLFPCVLKPLLNPHLAAMATVIKSEHQQRLSSRAVHSLPRGRLYT